MHLYRSFAVVLVILSISWVSTSAKADVLQGFISDVQPVLSKYCFDCHADGMDRGSMAFDAHGSVGELFKQNELWGKVVQRLRSDTMPPRGKARPNAEEVAAITEWVKWDVFALDPANPDPGHVTLRRLNRAEYRNTIDALMDYNFNTLEEFPADDSGYGFDNVGDALSISPLHMEKYINAAESIVYGAVPAVSRVPRESSIGGDDFRSEDGETRGGRLKFDEKARVSRKQDIGITGTYKIAVTLRINGGFEFEPGQCDVAFSLDDEVQFTEALSWGDGRRYTVDLERTLEEGEHQFRFDVTPEENAQEETDLDFRIERVQFTGPMESEHWIAPNGYDRYFGGEIPPAEGEDRDAFARETLRSFATRAFRRPVEEQQLDKLVALAKIGYDSSDLTFEEGVRQAMIAILASSRFLFITQEPDPEYTGGGYPDVDEYTLASRLSYFLWSTMPDNELLTLAAEGKLRENLDAQVERMLGDRKASAFFRNFAGQWLQTRDIETVPIDARAVLDLPRERRFRNVQFEGSVRRAMRDETYEYFEHIVRENRSILDLIDSDYTFLNEELAEHYGIEGVEGDRMRRVELAADSPRGGVLTQGSFLAVTSNPTRTSPVKRGVFVLESIMGASTPPPPADIPGLEEAEIEESEHEPTVRELLERHRDTALCKACHDRFDPMGMALENFNALGKWRDEDNGRPIDASGTLISGETFNNIIELKRILKEDRREDFYRCITEKLLTFALGRGIQYYDVHSIDLVVQALEADGGKFSTLLHGIVHSAPFQKMRRPEIIPGMQTASNAD